MTSADFMQRPLPRRPLGPFQVSPIGFGAMRLTGPGIFGPPSDLKDAVLLLREAVEAGVDHIDTAEYYGPHIVNQLICEALSPYPPQLLLVSKVGARRDDRGGVFAYDAPSQLRRAIEENLSTLAIDSMPVVNLRLMRRGEPDTFFDDQIGAMVAARDDGLIQAIGLSSVSLSHLRRALELTDIACVQNSFHPSDRSSQPVLEECTRRGIAFVPFAPLGSGHRGPGSALDADAVRRVAVRLRCSPAQVALRWALQAAPNILLIPGTASRRHLKENLDAATVRLDPDAIRDLSAA
ncbi:MAG TPA: aldo/keto reductase [Actinomycetes bacterium]|nr:aldo/keto reductase [Actinomycetes bacterium]